MQTGKIDDTITITGEKKDSKITFYDSHKHNEFITGLFGSKTGGRNVIKKIFFWISISNSI